MITMHAYHALAYRKMADVLSLKEHEVCLREAALLDCFVAAY